MSTDAQVVEALRKAAESLVGRPLQPGETGDILDRFNQPAMLTHLKKTDARVSRRTLRPLDRLLIGYRGFGRKKLVSLLEMTIDALVSPSTSPPVAEIVDGVPD